LAEYGVFRYGFENGVADLSDQDRKTPPEYIQKGLKFFRLSVERFDDVIQQVMRKTEFLEEASQPCRYNKSCNTLKTQKTQQFLSKFVSQLFSYLR
jgi:hypothetical protein